MKTEFIRLSAKLRLPIMASHPVSRAETIKRITDALSLAGELVNFDLQEATTGFDGRNNTVCSVCRWIHDAEFTQMKRNGVGAISLPGVLPDIVRVVHRAHEKGFERLSIKNDELLQTCGGYRHPSKAFDDLKRRSEYKLIFDTRKYGFILIRGAGGINRNKSESGSE